MPNSICNVYYSQHLGWHARENRWGVENRRVLTIRGLTIQRFFAGDDGTLFFVTTDGHLYYHKHDGWNNGELANGKLIRVDIGWAAYQFVSAGNSGYVYAIEANGDLLLYHQANLNISTFTPGMNFWDIRAHRIGSQWDQFNHAFAGNEGYLFGIGPGDENDFYLYKRNNWESTSNEYSIQRRGIGVNWEFGKYVFTGINNVIYAIDSNDRLLEYQHGEDGFYGAEGRVVGTGFTRANSVGIVCSRSRSHPQPFSSIYRSEVLQDTSPPVDNRNRDEITIIDGLAR